MNIKYLLYLLITISFYNISYGQEQLSFRDRAKQKYENYDYAQAIPMYLKLVDVKDPQIGDVEKLAYSYYKINDYEAAENWFSRLIAYPESKAEHLLTYGSVLKSNLRYIEAKKVFETYASKTGDTKKVANDLLGCDSAQLWLAKPTAHLMHNESAVNTSLSEFGVFPFAYTVFYTGEPDAGVFKSVYGRTGNPFLRIYTADRTASGTLSFPLVDKSVYNDADYHVGPVISNKAGKIGRAHV